ncbi:MAG: cytochrome c3 family protein [Anaeromyxobacter sp.]
MRTATAFLAAAAALLTLPAAAADLAARPPPPPTHGGDTECAACHTAEGWKPVKFAHERTGFPLEGRHRDVACRACHSSGTFAEPVARACSACHRDVHLGRLGQRCQDCHQPVAWAASFSPEDHRKTAFPLTGRHALTACENCHGDRRDRGFSRPTVACVGCHGPDWERASAGGAAVDHAGSGFPQDCRRCHSTWRFAPATLPQHQVCFDIRSGPHAGVRCTECHTTIPLADYSQTFTCATDTADCIRCHGDVSGEHQGVPGFQPVNRKCYECHQFSTGGALRARRTR